MNLQAKLTLGAVVLETVIVAVISAVDLGNVMQIEFVARKIGPHWCATSPPSMSLRFSTASLRSRCGKRCAIRRFRGVCER